MMLLFLVYISLLIYQNKKKINAFIEYFWLNLCTKRPTL